MGHELGLRVGLEVHQELKTARKLFCACPPRLSKEPELTFVRLLRPSQSELGEVDPAALFEFRQGRSILYEADGETSCLVEMDEEPPGPLDDEALDIGIAFALMVGGRPIDEVHVMRKIVVDGSNTAGFQRTCVIALGGSVEVGGRRINLEQVCLEEDAARKVADEGAVSRYRIDRLGIPLVEVSTAPEIGSPGEAEEVALAIGRILRATGRVRRGLGTIRQDLNVSVEGGALVEVKGVQELGLVSKVVGFEAERQRNLLAIAAELEARDVEPSDLRDEPVDVTGVFASTRCRVIGAALRKGHRVLALRLPGFGGLLGRELCPNRRLGTEMADRARAWGGVRGLLHSDELRIYDVTAAEEEALRAATGSEERDGIVLVADEEGSCRRALSAVLERAKEALGGVPSETRAAEPDGTTRYMRPRPGAARMYPETDVVAVGVTSERLERLRTHLPEMPAAKLARLSSEYGLNEKLARQLVDSDFCPLFEELAAGTGVPPTLIAVTLTETVKSLGREGAAVEGLGDEPIRGAFELLDEGVMAKEALPDVLRWLAAHPDSSARGALEALGLALLPRDELKRLVDSKVEENAELIGRMGERALGPLMGMVMGEVRGRARAEEVQALLRHALRDALAAAGEGQAL